MLALDYTQYDGNGNLQTRVDTQTTTTHTYSYDELNRLDLATGMFGHHDYDYDRNGNRTGFSDGTVTDSLVYAPNTNRLITLNGASVNLDANGNTTAIRDLTLGYNSYNRLVDINSAAVTYQYNGLGQRISKHISSGVNDNPSTINYYRYSMDGQLLGEYDEKNAPISEYVYLNGQVLAVIHQAQVYYVHHDRLGTPQKLSDATGNVVWSADYDPFGKAIVNEDVDGDGARIVFNVRLPGQYYDAETGLHYNYFRYYDPQTGRYITSDPIGLCGGLNTYGYVGGNPVNFSDQFGLLVDVYYDTTHGTVTVMDQDTGRVAHGGATSGGYPFGTPIPNGAYEILDQARNPESFRLDAWDQNMRNDIHDPTGRDHFRLHEPGRTIGCIATDDQDEWNQIRDIISKTRIETVMDNAAPWWKFWQEPVPITKYGNLYVY